MTTFLTRLASVLVIGAMLYVPTGARAASIPEPLSRMYDELAKVSSYNTSTTLTVDALYGSQKVSAVIAVTSVSDTREKAEVGFTITVTSNNPDFRREVGGSSATARGTFRMLSNKKAYVYFNELPELASNSIDLSKFEGKWIDLSGATDNYVRLSGKPESFASLVARMKASLIRYPAFSFYEDGTSSDAYRYRVVVNPLYLNSYVKAVNSNRVSLPSGDVSQMLAGLKDVRAYVSIDKKTYLPKELTATAATSQRIGSMPVSVTVAMKNRYTGFNDSVTIKKPTKTTTFEKLMTDILGPLRQKSADASSKSYLSAVMSQAELYYDDTGSYAGLCANSAIKRFLTGAGKTNCYAKATEYAAQVRLSSGYFCIDSTGWAVTTKKSSISSRDLTCN